MGGWFLNAWITNAFLLAGCFDMALRARSPRSRCCNSRSHRRSESARVPAPHRTQESRRRRGAQAIAVAHANQSSCMPRALPLTPLRQDTDWPQEYRQTREGKKRGHASTRPNETRVAAASGEKARPRARAATTPPRKRVACDQHTHSDTLHGGPPKSITLFEKSLIFEFVGQRLDWPIKIKTFV